MNAGDLGTITFGDNSTARVKFIEEKTYPATGMPSDYWLEYAEGETNRKLVHPDFGTKDFIKSEILLPEFLFHKVVTMD